MEWNGTWLKAVELSAISEIANRKQEQQADNCVSCLKYSVAHDVTEKTLSNILGFAVQRTVLAMANRCHPVVCYSFA